MAEPTLSKLFVSVGDIELFEEGFRPLIDPTVAEITTIGWSKDTREAMRIASDYFEGQRRVISISTERHCEFWPVGSGAQRKLGAQRYFVGPVWEPKF